MILIGTQAGLYGWDEEGGPIELLGIEGERIPDVALLSVY